MMRWKCLENQIPSAKQVSLQSSRDELIRSRRKLQGTQPGCRHQSALKALRFLVAELIISFYPPCAISADSYTFVFRPLPLPRRISWKL